VACLATVVTTGAAFFFASAWATAVIISPVNLGGSSTWMLPSKRRLLLLELLLLELLLLELLLLELLLLELLLLELLLLDGAPEEMSTGA
jgi:hypothetical protein